MNTDRIYITKKGIVPAKPVGTIYATPAQLAKADAFSDSQAAKNDRRAIAILSDCERRMVNGEIRYYETPTKYATARSGKVRWFEVRADGDYALKS